MVTQVEQISFGLESRPGRFGPDGGATLHNCYVEFTAKEAKKPWVVYCRAGLRSFGTVSGGGAYRGGCSFGEYGYIVSGTQVARVDSAGNAPVIGSFTGSRPVRMFQNRKSPNAQIAIVSDGQASLIEADIVSTITDPDLPAPIDGCSIGGYFVFLIEDGSYYWTAIDEGSTIDALDFASAEALPDGGVAIIDRSTEIVLFGPKSIEFHVLSGDDNVFVPISQSTIRQLGCASRDSVVSIEDVPIFVASDFTVRRLNAYTAEVISTHDVARDIRALTDKTTLVAWTFTQDGHQFYVLSCADWTWVCDLTTRYWYNWESYELDRWRVQGMVDVSGVLVAGDYNAATLYELDPDANGEVDDYLLWKLISGPIGSFPNRMIVDELFLDIVPGTGLNSADEVEANPQVTLRVSVDDGASFGTEESVSVGLIGETYKQVSFTGLGTSNEDGFRFEISMLAPVSRSLSGAAIRYQPLVP